MDQHIVSLLAQAQQYGQENPIIAIVATVVVTIISWRWLSCAHEGKALQLNVPIPRECEDGFWDNHDVSKAPSSGLGAEGQGVISCVCPADGRHLGFFKVDDPKSMDAAIRRATNAQPKWAETTFAQRRQVLRTLLKYVLEHQEDIVTACCLDSGKTRLDAYFGEILVTAEKLQWTIDHGEKALQTTKRPTNFLMFYKDNEVRYEPLGVVSACVSWNYPFHNFISPIISAIFAGNAIVVKPSEQVAWSSTYFTNLVRGAISACSHSDSIVQSVVCLPEHADYLTSHPGISYITFIGSREIAHKVCASASKPLTPVCVELGGKDPSIILDDRRTVASLEDVASILMRGVFQNAGQNCIGIERVIALPGVYDKLIEIVKPKIEQLKIGSVMLDETCTDPTKYAETGSVSPEIQSHIDTTLPPTTDVGAMISSRPFQKLESLISSAVKAGAVLHHGGKVFPHPRYPHGTFFTPTLLSGVTPSMDIAQNELFAPVFLIMRAETVDQAIELANSSEYALGASVFGYDDPATPGRGGDIEKCVKGIKAGMVSVNDFGAFYATSLPFGGVKGSGYGRFGGAEGLQGLCNIKAVCKDRWSGSGFWIGSFFFGWPGISTKIPFLVDLPAPKFGSVAYGGSLRGRDMVRGVVETGYGLGLLGKATGIVKLLAAISEPIAWLSGKGSGKPTKK